jgi:hypothetical protein
MFLAGNEGWTTTTCGEAAAMVTGAKLFTASYGTLLDTVGATAKSLVTNKMVCPSPGELAAVPVPTTPLAPVRFSTKKFWPRLSVRCCATRRAITSVGPPAG